MTAQKTKPTQKRLNNCVLSPLRWAKIYEKLENCACGTLKIKDAVANAAVRVANAPKKGQARRNTTLLGKYPIPISNRSGTIPGHPYHGLKLKMKTQRLQKRLLRIL